MRAIIFLFVSVFLFISCGQDDVYYDAYPPPPTPINTDYFIDDKILYHFTSLQDIYMQEGLGDLSYVQRIETKHIGTANGIDEMSTCMIYEGKYYLILNSYYTEKYFARFDDYSIRSMIARVIGNCHHGLAYLSETGGHPPEIMWEFLMYDVTKTNWDKRWSKHVLRIKDHNL